METPIILIADDDADLTAVLSARLEAAGYEVVTAQTGAEALSKASAAKPDLFILDINIPVGSGFTIHECVRAQGDSRACPVIFISGEQIGWLRRAAMDHGAYAFLTKPIDTRLLMDVVADALAYRNRLAG